MSVEPPARLGATRLPDGRLLAWSEWGPEDGRPVLLCPGAATSRWLGIAAGVPDAVGVRLVSVDRPGLGGSDPAPGRTLGTWADDVTALLRLRGLTGARAVAFSQGAPFGLACAAAGVVEALAVVSGTDELAAPDVRPHLSPEIGQLVDLCSTDPAAAAAAFAGLASVEAMAGMVTATSSPVDQAVYAEPDFAAAYRRALSEAFAAGPQGYVEDTLLAMGCWPLDLRAVPVPVHLWYGGQDASPVHSPDSGARLHRILPGSRRTVLGDAGGALLWTHGEDVLTELLAA